MRVRRVFAESEAAVNRATVASQDARGDGLVALHGRHHLGDVAPLQLGHGDEFRRFGAVEARDDPLALTDRLGEIVEPQVVELGERDRLLHAVLQLAHVAGPRVRDHRVDRRCGEAEHALPVRLIAKQHVVRENQNVATARAERRELDVNDVDPVEQILAEPLLGDLVFQVAVRRRHDARVERDLFVSSHGAKRALLQGAKQLGLHSQGHLADLVEKERAAAGLQEEAAARLPGVGEGALHVAEELTLQDVFGHRGAVDGDERALRPGAARVDRPGRELLSGAALAGDEHVRFGLRDPLDEIVGAGHGRRRSDHVLEALRALDPESQPAHLLAKRVILHAAIERHHEVVGVEGLGDVVVGARAHGGDRGVDAPERRHDHDGDDAIGGDDARAQIGSRDPLHLKVGEDDVDVVGSRFEAVEGFLGAVRERDAVRPLREFGLEDRAETRVVVHNQNVLSHGTLLPTRPKAWGVPTLERKTFKGLRTVVDATWRGSWTGSKGPRGMRFP